MITRYSHFLVKDCNFTRLSEAIKNANGMPAPDVVAEKVTNQLTTNGEKIHANDDACYCTVVYLQPRHD